MIALLLARPWMLALLAGLLAAGGGYVWGRVDGRTAGKVDQLEATVEAIEKRGRIDSDVGSASQHDLCIDLGGSKRDCETLTGQKAAERP